MNAGAVYSPARGAALCPACSTWAKRTCTYAWDEEMGICIRHHKCPECGDTFKSIQEDPTIRAFSQEKTLSV